MGISSNFTARTTLKSLNPDVKKLLHGRGSSASQIRSLLGSEGDAACMVRATAGNGSAPQCPTGCRWPCDVPNHMRSRVFSTTDIKDTTLENML